MSDVLDLHRDDCDEAIRNFKAYLDRSGTCTPDEAACFAVSALSIAQKSSGRCMDIKELSDAAGVLVTDIEAVSGRVRARESPFLKQQGLHVHMVLHTFSCDYHRECACAFMSPAECVLRAST